MMMVKKFLLSIILASILLFASAQLSSKNDDSPVKILIDKLDQLISDYPQEKVYFHLNKPAFVAGEDLWFKAYIVDATFHKFSLVSNNLYVELISAEGKIVSHKLYWIERGVANGDFFLNDSLPSGIYQIRAYTSWMRNFAEGFFFRTNFQILNLINTEANGKLNHSYFHRNDVDLQFFPEGGTFINNIKCHIAFKALDSTGHGIEVQGRIIDNLGKEVGQFASSHLGMGSFYLIPENGKTYHAELNFENQVKSYNLPLASNDGVVISVDNSNIGYINVALLNPDSLKQDVKDEYTIIGQLRGKVCFWAKIKKDKNSVKIPSYAVPTGILQLTVFDKSMLPVCERLVFVNHHQYCNINISSNKLKYGPREKVELAVNANGPNGNLMKADLSISVYSSNFNAFRNIDAGNILTNLLLTSDLKGNIENPDYYFSSDSIQVRNALDILMMTQGWSRFIWKDVVAGKKPDIVYQPEHGINVQGSVRRLWVDKPLPNSKITLLLFDKNNQIFNGLYSKRFSEGRGSGLIYLPLGGKNKLFETTSDSIGNFKFDNLYFTDSSKVLVQAVGKKGKKNAIISLKDTRANPIVGFLPPYQIYNSERKTDLNTPHDLINELKRTWLKSGDILLKEVTVSGYAKKEDHRYRLYGTPDYEYNVGNETSIYSTVLDMLQSKIPGLMVSSGASGQTVTLNRRGMRGTPLFLIDGMVTEPDFVNMLTPSSVDKIELVLNPTETSLFTGNLTTGSSGANGIISIFTKNGAVFNSNRLQFNIAYQCPVGYTLSREFYSPKYDVPANNEIPDVRNTLYWAPYLFTDSTGTAKLSFYTNDVVSQYIISVEGITDDGKVCKGNSVISVVKKE
jgi:hypothetical protein